MGTNAINDPLEACRKKLERAARHLAELDDAIQEWGKPYPHEVSKSFDSERGEFVLSVSNLRPTPTEWSIVVGDALHSMRSTLDHVVCVLIRTKNPDNSCANSGFPILSKKKSWDAKQRGALAPYSGLGRIHGVDDWSEDFIRRRQPFNLSEEDRRKDALWLLNELNNVDKHRALNLTSAFHYKPDFGLHPPDSGEVVWIQEGGTLREGDPIIRYRLREHRPAGKVSTQGSFGLDVVFQDTHPTYGMKVQVLLRWIHETVAWVVDTFGYKYFDGPPPSGLTTITIPAG